MKIQRIQQIIGGLALAAALLAGCGPSGTTPAPTEAAPPPAGEATAYPAPEAATPAGEATAYPAPTQ